LHICILKTIYKKIMILLHKKMNIISLDIYPYSLRLKELYITKSLLLITFFLYNLYFTHITNIFLIFYKAKYKVILLTLTLLKIKFISKHYL
jgi:hypothetical protein